MTHMYRLRPEVCLQTFNKILYAEMWHLTIGLLISMKKNATWYYLIPHFEKVACLSKLLFHFESLFVSNVIFDRRLFLSFSFIRREQLVPLTTKIYLKMNWITACSVLSHALLKGPWSVLEIPSKFHLLKNLFAEIQHGILMFPGRIHGILMIKTDCCFCLYQFSLN